MRKFNAILLILLLCFGAGSISMAAETNLDSQRHAPKRESSWMQIIKDFIASLDGSNYDHEGCIPSEVDDCGIQEPQ